MVSQFPDDSAEDPNTVRRFRVRSRSKSLPRGGQDRKFPIDPYRSVVFPNRIREHRIRAGHARLFAFSHILPEIPYIRMSKLERGEVFARPDELWRIANALHVAPIDLLIDLESGSFDMADWYQPFWDGSAKDEEDEAVFAVLLAAAIRARRYRDTRLTAATMNAQFKIPAVILSRLENAQKGLARWNSATVYGLCKFFEVDGEAELREHVQRLHRDGQLDEYFGQIPGPEEREVRTRQRLAVLAADLRSGRSSGDANNGKEALVTGRQVAVYGSAVGDGLISMTRTSDKVEVPSFAGPKSFGLRVGKATLGGGMPSHATIIVDPDRYPQAGGLAVVREQDAWRVLAVTVDRYGRMHGYSTQPARELELDTVGPDDIASVIAAVLI